jgi:xylono-1,5-lactonase
MSSLWRVVARERRDLLGEGPLWSSREHALFWVDILAHKVNRLSLADETVASWTVPEMIGWLIEREHAPGFIAGMQSGFAELTLDPLHIVALVDPEPERPHNRLNDAKADRYGRIWAGSMPVAANEAGGALYRFDPDRTVTRVDAGYTIANGPAVSPDGSVLYHTDSGRGVIFRFRVDAQGALHERRSFIEFEASWGKPDGMTLDHEGGLWVAHYGGGRVSRFHDDGRLDRSIALPASHITSCTFAGAELERMFVTSAADGAEHEAHAGGLFEVDAGVRGWAPHRFAG